MQATWIWMLTASALLAASGCEGKGTGGTGGGEPAAPSCPSRFADCDGDPGNGCEAALRTSVESCGACGHACATPASATALCVDGTCAFACKPGTGDCDGDPGNGCEATLATDVANCGACGAACSKTCTEGTCDVTVLAQGQLSPIVVAVDATSVYWLNYGPMGMASGAVMRVDKAGSAPTAFASGLMNPRALLLDGDEVYWATSDGSIQRAPKAGGPPTTLAQNQSAPVALAIAKGVLYWANTGTAPSFTDGAILALDLQSPGATPVSLGVIPGGLAALVVAGGSLYATVFGSGQNPDGSLWRVGLSPQAGTPQLVSGALSSPSALVGTPDGLWLSAQMAILSTPTGGTTPPRSLVAELTAQPLLLALDGDRLWWTTLSANDGRIASAGLDGSSPNTRAHGLAAPRGIAVDESHVYWTQVSKGVPASGTVLSMPK